MANSDYGAIPLTLAESTSEALNTKLGVSTGFKPTEWPSAIASIPSGIEPISLKNNYMIGDSDHTKYPSPIDANNYVEVSGNDVILHRNDAIYHLWCYTPLLQAGNLYTISFDSASNTNGYIYIEYATDITTNPVSTTRIAAVRATGISGYTFIAPANGYYGIIIWNDGNGDISMTNPRLIDYSAA